MSSSNTVYWVGAESADPSALPCTGIRGTFDVVPTSSTGEGLYAVWVALELADDWWAQTGYYFISGGALGFYQIWDLTTNYVETTGTFPLTADGSAHQFSIVYSGANDIWDFYMDSTLTGSYNLGTAISAGTSATQPFEALVEQQLQGGPAFSIPTITFNPAFQSLQNGVWQDVTYGYVLDTGPYGVQGQVQNSALAPAQIVVGSSIATLSDGTPLWNGSAPPTPTPTTISLKVTQIS